MTLSKTLIGLFISGGLSYASSLAVYQDSTFYSYTPSSNFIGFTQGVSAKCDGSTLSILPMNLCPEEDRLCKISNSLDDIKQDILVNETNTKVLEKFISLPQPQEIDASAWIASAKLIGEEQATLLSAKEALTKSFKQEERLFRKQAPYKVAKKTADLCEKELSLTLPYGYVSFSTLYEANIEEKELTVTQKLSIVNRSGIDIEADTAMFYYRSANQYVRPLHFSPWIVSKYVAREKRMYKKVHTNAAPMLEASMVVDSEMGGDIMPAPVASYEDAREYKITNLKIPSTGTALDVDVISWKVPLECEVRAYPYMNTKAFHMCSFTPKYQIDSNTWKVKSGTEVINERAVGEYRKGKYNIYTKVEEDIQILRKPIVKKERKTGIFGGTARKQDGFTLTLTNKSNKVKELTLIERIPTSTSTEIKSKLLSINSKSKVDYKMLKDGEVEMHIMLNANETQKIDVLFEISYDKDLKVNY
jgi:hypothetical protein